MKRFIFIDESGTLPDPKDSVIVVAAVGTTTPERISALVKKVRKKAKLKRKSGEMKFYNAGEKTKLLFFQKMTKEKFDIFSLVVEKMGRKIPDTPKHFALLCSLLLKEVAIYYSDLSEVIFDRHFHRAKDRDDFDTYLQKFMGTSFSTAHVDSQKNIQVNIADMVAGAVLAKERSKEKYYLMIKSRIISETRINWPEAKRRLFLKRKIA